MLFSSLGRKPSINFYSIPANAQHNKTKQNKNFRVVINKHDLQDSLISLYGYQRTLRLTDHLAKSSPGGPYRRSALFIGLGRSFSSGFGTSSSFDNQWMKTTGAVYSLSASLSLSLAPSLPLILPLACSLAFCV